MIWLALDTQISDFDGLVYKTEFYSENLYDLKLILNINQR